MAAMFFLLCWLVVPLALGYDRADLSVNLRLAVGFHATRISE